jgi:hypothetical protein
LWSECTPTAYTLIILQGIVTIVGEQGKLDT